MIISVYPGYKLAFENTVSNGLTPLTNTYPAIHTFITTPLTMGQNPGNPLLLASRLLGILDVQIKKKYHGQLNPSKLFH